jgi:L-iditol 2-dehydrogenase
MTELHANRIHYDEIRVIGSFSYHPDYHRRALRLLERGQIDPDLIITHTYPLDEIEQVFRTVAAGEALKVMVEIGQGGAA